MERKEPQGMLTQRPKRRVLCKCFDVTLLEPFHGFNCTYELKVPRITRGEKTSGRFHFISAHLSQACCCKAYPARGSLLPSQANIRAGANQVGKLELLVEPFRYFMPPFFMSPLTKGYGSKRCLSLCLSHTQTHTRTLRCTAKPAAPSLTLFLMPFEIVFPLPSQSAV